MKLERTRASEAKPARERPRCSSIEIIFFWYEESSSALRYMSLVSFVPACIDDGMEERGSERSWMGDVREVDIPSELRERHVSC